MGSSYTTLKNLSSEYKDQPQGCISCVKHTPGNPGVFNDIHKKFDDLDPKCFDGIRLTCKKNLSSHFHVTHTLAMKTKLFPALFLENEEHSFEGYKFGASYTGLTRVGNTENYPIVNGEITPNGDLKASCIHTLGCRCRLKLSTQVKRNRYKNLRMSAEYRTDDSTLTVTLVEPAILNLEGLLLVQFLQAVTSRITLGAEIACNRKLNLPVGDRQTNLAGAFRYSTGYQTFSTTFGQTGIHVSYHHIHAHNIQLGVEIKSNFLQSKHKGKLVYRVDYPTSRIKGFLDTDGRLGAVFETKLQPVPEASLVLSGFLDHIKNNMSIGIGLNYG